MGELLGKVVVITGATGSMGSAVAKRFAREGSSLILVSRSIDKLQALNSEMGSMGFDAEKFMLVSLDLEDFGGVKNLAASISLKYGYIDVLISSAAILGDSKRVQDYDLEMWNKVINVNLTSNWNLLKHFDSLLKASPAGRVVFITSETIQSVSSYLYWGLYAVSKSALETLVKIYAAETKHSKLCVNLVYPGAINSKIYSQAFSATISNSKEQEVLDDEQPKPLIAPETLIDEIIDLSTENCSVTGQAYQLYPTMMDS